MVREATASAEHAELWDLIERLAEAVRKTDVEAYLAYCAPEIVVFDLVPPLQHVGSGAVRDLWAHTLQKIEGPVVYEINQLDVTVDRDVAFSRSLNRFVGAGPDGRDMEHWLRVTQGFRRNDSAWRLVHEHLSAPIDMATGRAQLTLRP